MIGASFNQYRLTASLGAGGMGEVFRARDIRLNRNVAIKMLPKGIAGDPDRLRRFEQESKTLAALNHPNILTIHDAGVHEGAPFLVSELLEGKTLREELNPDRSGLPLRKAADYALQIAQGLAAANGKGIIHRDLKPENIFITKDGRVKILDFGLAKLQSDLRSQISDSKSQVDPNVPTLADSTQPGVVLGTPAYMSPEQVRGEPADHRSDIFAFGSVLYEMLSGLRAFQRNTAAETMSAVLKEEPPELTETQSPIPPALERVVRRCLEKQPDRRFQNATDVGFAIDALSLASTTAAPSHPAIPPQRAGLGRRLLMGTAIVVTVCLAYWVGRAHRAAAIDPAISWRGERLDGPSAALSPRISPDGKEVAFAAMVDGQTQVAVMMVDSGDWKILTTNRNRGLVNQVSWSPDGSQLFYDRAASGPNGVYRISKYGGDERLVLEAAGDPKVRPDGSILLARRTPDARLQSFLYFPETEQLRALNASPINNPISQVTMAADGSRAVFRGTLTNGISSASHFWVIDLNSGQTLPFLTEVDARFEFSDVWPFALSPDGSQFVFAHRDQTLIRLFSVELNAPKLVRPLLPLTRYCWGLDMDRAGNLIVDQSERPTEILRRGTGTVERIEIPTAFRELRVLPLPENRFLLASPRDAGALLVFEPGKAMRPFLESKLETSPPVARLGSNQVIFTLHEGTRCILCSASLDGRGIKRIHPVNWPISTYMDMSVAGSPDGRTIYYTEGDFIYAVPAAGGAAEKIHAGDSVAVDPAGRYLVIKAYANGARYLLRLSLSDRTEQRLSLSGKYRLAGDPLAPNAIARDGRILARVSPFDSWFWPAAIIDPVTGEEELATEFQADMDGSGWDDEGRLVTGAAFLRSSVWRFHPEIQARLK